MLLIICRFIVSKKNIINDELDYKKLLLSLGEIIREKRKALGYSQEGFADLVGLHRTYIGSVERGEKNISFINLRKIAEKLNISLSELLIKIPD